MLRERLLESGEGLPNAWEDFGEALEASGRLWGGFRKASGRLWGAKSSKIA